MEKAKLDSFHQFSIESSLKQRIKPAKKFQSLNLRSDRSVIEPKNKRREMADIVNNVCRKKSFFICLTVICLLLLVAAIIAASILNKPNKNTCLLNHELSCNHSTLNRNYGTKTDYIVGRGNVPDAGKAKVKHGCEAIQLYFVSRHAIRYPDGEDIVEMEEMLPNLRHRIATSLTGKLCNSTKDELESWKLAMTEKDDNRISISGEVQAKELGERFKAMYATLFDKPYNENDYVFGFTSRERTKETAVKFAEGIFGNIINLNSPPVDDLLQFHKNCDQKLKKLGYKKDKPNEEKLFLNSTFMETTLKNIRERLGFDVQFDEVKSMLRLCQFEFAIDGKSVWCSIFSDNDIKVFEYLEDINDYYNDGYGGPERNYLQACPLLSNILTNFRLAIQGEHPRANLMFSHAGAFKKLVAALGLFKDEKPLTSDALCSADNRQWKSSQICPFNANVAFTLFKCGNSLKVETLMNEKAVTIKGCSSAFCPFEEFEAVFKPHEKCNLDEVCVLKH